MSVIKCTACNGRKRVLGLGMIERDCKACDATGWIKPIEQTEVVEKPKKRGDKK